jgi:hypothetical protein
MISYLFLHLWILLFPHCELRVIVRGVEASNATYAGPYGATMDWERSKSLEKMPFVDAARCFDERNERALGR